ncbi:MAG: sigma-70 family RNA polymerase sigma factor [Bacteroidales bacterium]|nr:sigma-70 family RNA polymerase sigma factor [Bacteroidales bacterium]
MAQDQKRNTIDIHIDLVKACKKNDRKAQFRLYELYSKAMFNTSLRIVKDRQIAEDIMQESFLSAYNSITDFREEVPFGVWLKKIIINKSLDHLRKNRPIFEELKEETLPGIEQGDRKESQIDNEKLIRSIKTALLELPDGYRIILSLSLFEGYDHEEIGQILNITTSTSRSQLTRAKKRLKEKLNKITKHHD